MALRCFRSAVGGRSFTSPNGHGRRAQRHAIRFRGCGAEAL